MNTNGCTIWVITDNWVSSGPPKKRRNAMFLLFSLYTLWFARTPTACEPTPHPFELPSPADLTACQRPLLWRRKNKFQSDFTTCWPPHSWRICETVSVPNQSVRTEGLGRRRRFQRLKSQAVRPAGKILKGNFVVLQPNMIWRLKYERHQDHSWFEDSDSGMWWRSWIIWRSEAADWSVSAMRLGV